MPTAAITPQQTQSVSGMGRGGVWTTHARRLLDDFSVKFVPEQMHRVTRLTAAVTWACNSAIDDSWHSPAQWVLGRGLRLPYTLDQTGRLSLHEWVTRDRTFSGRIAMMSAAQRSITSLRYDRALSRAVLARPRAHGAVSARQLFQVKDVVYCWSGNGKAKREWAAHWHGPATVVGLQHESLWLANRTTTVKWSKGHVRHATASEQFPLGPMLDALRAPPVPPGRDMQASEDLFMDLDEPSSKRSRDTPSGTQQSDFANPDEFVQRAQNVSVPLPRTPVQPVPAPETLSQPVPHGSVAPVTPPFRSDEAMPSTPPFQCQEERRPCRVWKTRN